MPIEKVIVEFHLPPLLLIVVAESASTCIDPPGAGVAVGVGGTGVAVGVGGITGVAVGVGIGVGVGAGTPEQL